MKGKHRGQIVLWDENRSFGFLQCSEVLPFGDDKIFMHRSNCIDAPFIGAECEFEVGDAYKIGRKPQAVNVTVLLNAAGLDALAKGFPDAEIGTSEGGAQ